MVISLTNIINSVGLKKDFLGTLSINEFEFGGEVYTFAEPLKISGSITNNGSFLELSAEVSGYIHLSCYRCTDDITKAFEFSMSEKLANNDYSEQDDEVIKFEGNSLDITNIILNNIFVNLSMKYLCSENCKGLCTTCGTNLNIGECSCTNEEIDPRFEALKKLLSE